MDCYSGGMSNPYMAYLLRLWMVDGARGKGIWRASLEDPHTGAVRAFASLEALMEFLRSRIQEQASSEAVEGPTDTPLGMDKR